MNKVTELNDLFYVGSNISLWKNQGSLENQKLKIKTRMKNLVENADKKTTTTSKNAETEHKKYIWTKRKSMTIRTKNTIRRDEFVSTGERRKTKKIQTMQTKQDIPKQENKILHASRGDWAKSNQQLDVKEGKKILEQNMGTERS